MFLLEYTSVSLPVFRQTFGHSTLRVTPYLLAVHYLVPWHGWHPVRVSFQCPHFLAVFHIPKRRSSIRHSNRQKSATNVWGSPFDGAHVVNFARQGQQGTNFTRVGIPDQSKIRLWKDFNWDTTCMKRHYSWIAFQDIFIFFCDMVLPNVDCVC